MIVFAAPRKSCFLSACVASAEPFPGSARPSASVKQFMLFAVNIPEHDPHVGQADCSTFSTVSSSTFGSTPMIIASTRSRPWSISSVLPASIGPPETKTAGILRRIAAINIPGVILSQLEIQTMASAQCALAIYSTLSAIISRLGNE